MSDLACPDTSTTSNLTLEQLEDRLRRLAGELAATECDFLESLAEFDRREGWGGWGMRLAAHWLSLHCGMQLGAARERVRVARSLAHLPQVRAAFAEGQLSYCKVRALSRVATQVTEPELVEIALSATGAQLERVVRSWRTTLVAEMAASSHLRRGFRRREETDGSVLYTVRVAPESAAIIDAAFSAAREVVLDEDGKPIETPEETRLVGLLTDEPPITRAGADALVVLAETFLSSGAVEHRGGSVEVIIHADLDALPVVVEPTMTDSADATDGVELGRRQRPPSAEGAPDGTSITQRASVLRPPTCEVENGGALSPSTVLRLLCEASVRVMVSAGDGNPLDLGRSARHANRRQRRALKRRDGTCRFPSCTRTRRLIPHHVHWWSHGGRTDMDGLILVCPAHHHAVHEVGYTIAALGGGRFAFYRPDGVRLPETGPPCELLDRARGDRGIGDRPIDGSTISPTWAGERLDIDMLVHALAANTINAAGHDLMTVPDDELAATLRQAARWPLDNRPKTTKVPTAA